MATKKPKRIKKRAGPVPALLGKSAAHQDRTKYSRKEKHREKLDLKET